MCLEVRPELPEHRQAIYELHVAAFPDDTEARLVECLRASAEDLISLVALQGEELIGHILFTPVSVYGADDARLAGLAPLAVLPRRQRSGVGKALVHAGLHRCVDAGYGAVFVLGMPGYYRKFGFGAALQYGLRCEYEAPDDAFMALELRPLYLSTVSGTVRYDDAFANF